MKFNLDDIGGYIAKQDDRLEALEKYVEGRVDNTCFK